MRAGKLDRRITLSARTVKQDTTGDGVDVFTPFGDVWAQVIVDRGNEAARAGGAQRQAQAAVTFRIRWRCDLARDMRVTYDCVDYDVIDILEIGRRVGADLRATASVK